MALLVSDVSVGAGVLVSGTGAWVESSPPLTTTAIPKAVKQTISILPIIRNALVVVFIIHHPKRLFPAMMPGVEEHIYKVASLPFS
jgi:hypothetical protein